MALFPLGILSAAGAGGGAVGDYELIATTILPNSVATTVTFSNLGDYSSTYKHLQIRWTARTVMAASTSDSLIVRANGISTTSYAHHQLVGNGSVMESGGSSSINQMRLGRITAVNGTTNAFGAGVIDILDPYSTTKNTTFRGFSGTTGADNFVFLYSGFFNNTASITQLDLSGLDNSGLVAGSRFSIYGIRG
jgi:hypothetical protein